MCAMMLLSFRNPQLSNNRIIPTMAGINEVNDGVSEPKYPQSPSRIKTNALIRLARYGFILEVVICM